MSRKARAEGYTDGLEGGASRAKYYPEPTRPNYLAGYTDGVRSRDERRDKLREASEKFFGDPYEEMARHIRTGRWAGPRIMGFPQSRKAGKSAALGMGYGDPWTRPDPVRMTAADIVPLDHPWFAWAALLQMDDERRRARIWMGAYSAAMAASSSSVFMDEFMAPLMKADEDALKFAMEAKPEWAEDGPVCSDCTTRHHSGEWCPNKTRDHYRK